MSLIDRQFRAYIAELEADLARTRALAWSLAVILLATILTVSVMK
jgi:hypothetical protein